MSVNIFEKRSKIHMGEEPFFVNFSNSKKHPRHESFSEMLKISCFPKLKLKSLTFFIFLVNIAVFSGCFYYAGLSGGVSELLTPTQKALFDFGMNYPYFMVNQQEVERIVGALFLFANLKHLLVSLLSLLVFGSYAEFLLGFKKTFIGFVTGGLGGFLLSCLMSDQPSVMGSNIPATFLGVLVGFMIIKWDKWDYPGSGRIQMLFVLFFGLVAMYSVAIAFPLVDSLAMSGSLIIGVLFFFGIYQDSSSEFQAHQQSRLSSSALTYNEDSKFSRYFSLFLIALHLVGGTFVFIFMRTPKLF